MSQLEPLLLSESVVGRGTRKFRAGTKSRSSQLSFIARILLLSFGKLTCREERLDTTSTALAVGNVIYYGAREQRPEKEHFRQEVLFTDRSLLLPSRICSRYSRGKMWQVTKHVCSKPEWTAPYRNYKVRLATCSSRSGMAHSGNRKTSFHGTRTTTAIGKFARF